MAQEHKTLLNRITSPHEVKGLSEDQLRELAADLRREIVNVVSSTGGHLASNLGTVELTVALMRVFDLSADKIVWDTGHQSYSYKLLTGRRELFQRLRQYQGCCGFPTREESPYDAFATGHAGTAISAALGMAVARDRGAAASSSKIIAVVGDGALGSGVSLEGLNSIKEQTDNLIVVVNDNRMSIGPNVGAMSKYLTRLISGRTYNRVKKTLRRLVCRIPFCGRRIHRGIQRVEEATKSMLVPGVLFEELGLRYIGPIDGHDIGELVGTFESLKELNDALVVHVVTEKGRGCSFAEESPEDYHGTGKFDIQSGELSGGTEQKTFSCALGRVLSGIAQKNEDMAAITAGMTKGTGLAELRQVAPQRCFDVGIAEEHAVVLAAGMAAAGWRPVVAIYATFIQRAMDYVFHDVCLQNLPVVFCLDRAGVVSDGPTHHGIFEVGFWWTLPNLAILQPADEPELRDMLEQAFGQAVPTVIRYPKASAAAVNEVRSVRDRSPVQWGRAEVLREGADVAIWAAGRECITAVDTADKLAEHGVDAAVINTRFLRPLDRETLQRYARTMPVVTVENHCVDGGLGSIVAEELLEVPSARLQKKGWPREVVPWGKEPDLRAAYGLEPEALCADIRQMLESASPKRHPAQYGHQT